jgi:rhodanese-related sulfurtransferase
MRKIALLLMTILLLAGCRSAPIMGETVTVAGGSYQNIAAAEKNSKIVVYCRSGRMGEIAAEEFVKLGYSNLWNLTGGMLEWEQAGYSLE